MFPTMVNRYRGPHCILIDLPHEIPSDLKYTEKSLMVGRETSKRESSLYFSLFNRQQLIFATGQLDAAATKSRGSPGTSQSGVNLINIRNTVFRTFPSLFVFSY